MFWLGKSLIWHIVILPTKYLCQFIGFCCERACVAINTYRPENSNVNQITTNISILRSISIAWCSYSSMVEKTLKAKHVNTMKNLLIQSIVSPFQAMIHFYQPLQQLQYVSQWDGGNVFVVVVKRIRKRHKTKTIKMNT